MKARKAACHICVACVNSSMLCVVCCYFLLLLTDIVSQIRHNFFLNFIFVFVFYKSTIGVLNLYAPSTHL